VFLKTLQIKGFKSFADAATIALEPGVTVVVGPNGSGKSNVVDAIGWVLGAQAPSTVRSQKMDDVIFAGSGNRPALGRAEVAITIDNSAGLLPIDFTEVTISRLLFRSGDSEYAINGVPCRLLDITDLLSDTGVGRQQHVIISQGNIDAVLNSRPEDRRLIIEEAAGVLKYRRRKERSQRRLAETDDHLTRVQDLLREVRRQLRPLERQAEAARRHGDLVAELTGLRLFVAGREVDRLRRALERSALLEGQLRNEGDRLRAGLGTLDARITAGEADLAALGGRDLSDLLVRFERLRERTRGIAALLVERLAGVDREISAAIDAAVVTSLEAERGELESSAEQVGADRHVLEAESDELLRDEAALAELRTAFELEWGDGVVVPSGEGAALRGEIAALTTAGERARVDEERLGHRRGVIGTRLERLGLEHEELTTAMSAATAATPALQAEARTTLRSHEDAESELSSASSAATDAEVEHSAWTARVEALALALDEARDRSGASRLSGLDGTLGTLAELVKVDDGWVDAFEAAASEALGAVVVADVAAARRGLRSLVDGDHVGAVIALGSVASIGSPISGPAFGEPVRPHVRPSARAGSAAAGVSALLDVLLERAVRVDGTWEAAVDASLRDPSAIVVTSHGGRYGSTGWRLRAAGAGATGAALDEAALRVDATASARDAARVRLDDARTLLDRARSAAVAAERSLDANRLSIRELAERLERIEHDRIELTDELRSLDAHIAELVERTQGEAARLAELQDRVPEVERAEAEVDARALRLTAARDQIETSAATIAARRTDLEVRTAALDERRRYVEQRLAQVGERLSRLEFQQRSEASKHLELETRRSALGVLADAVGRMSSTIDDRLGALRDERRVQSEAARAATELLEGLRAQRSAAEGALETARTELQQSELAETETRLRLETLTETLRLDHDCGPDTAAATECPPLPDGVTAPARIRELERELRIMGPINPLALAEFTELSERHDLYVSQLDDIRQSRRELTKVIKAIDEEIVSVFASAYADVSENFSRLFEALFPGGQGRLSLTTPDDLLETGIELEARPSGKNVRKLSLLSGGERSLTALAYLFAVFRSRPSPFYVMDEVEAALDDVNLHRFLDLVAEFRDTAQLIIVSHQKRTMEAADILYGVTMEPGGSTKVISERAASVLE